MHDLVEEHLQAVQRVFRNSKLHLGEDCYSRKGDKLTVEAYTGIDYI